MADLDKGGVSGETVRVYFGPSLGWFQEPTLSVTSLTWGPTTGGIPTKATGELYYDATGGYAERNAPFNIVTDTGTAAPPGIMFQQYTIAYGKGNNATFIGTGAGYHVVQDRGDVTALNKGVLYGLSLSLRPSVNRNNVPFDDATGFLAQNDGTGKATDAFYLGSGALAGSQWVSGFLADCACDYAFRATHAHVNGLRLDEATFTGNAIVSPGFSVDGSGNITVNGAPTNAKLNIKAIGLYTNTELSAGNGLVITTGTSTGNDYALYMGGDNTNFLSYIQSIQWGTAIAQLSLNLRGGDILLGASGYNVKAAARIIGSDSILSNSASGGVGYATGAGGTVTQITSRTTGVVINKVCGAITLFTAAPVVGTWVTFTVTNSTVGIADVPQVSVRSATNTYVALVSAVTNGSFNITFQSVAGTASDAPVINFAVIKGVTS